MEIVKCLGSTPAENMIVFLQGGRGGGEEFGAMRTACRCEHVWPVPPKDCSDEDQIPAPRLVKIPCKLIFSITLEDLGLPDARYNCRTNLGGGSVHLA